MGSRKSKDRQYNGRKKGDKRTSNDLENSTQKAKDWVIPVMNLGAPEGKAFSAPLVAIVVLHTLETRR